MHHSNPMNPKIAAKMLNAHAVRTSAGFYASIIGGRYFQARVREGALEISDFDTWKQVSEEQAKFHDHNGREIPLY